MIGNDARRYHSQIHGPVHYTDNIAYHYPLSSVWLSGSAEDPFANRQNPFLGNMFIQGCVSADGWLNRDGSCVKLAKKAPPCRGVSICGDHMLGALHMSHMVISDDTGYDFRNAEVSFEHDKQTFKTILCDFKRPFGGVLQLGVTNVKPGCVSTLRIIVPESARQGSVRLSWHPGLKWLTPRPLLVNKKFIAIISFESYGTGTEDVYCSYREECVEQCDTTLSCIQSGLSGFDTIQSGVSSDVLSGMHATQSLTSCWQPVEFVPWTDDCGTTYAITLTTDDPKIMFYNFKDYYTHEDGTRLWQWDKSDKYNITGEPYYNQERVTRFNINIEPTYTKDKNIPLEPDWQLYQGNYINSSNATLSGQLIFDSLSSYDDSYFRVTHIPAQKKYVVLHDRRHGHSYIIKFKRPLGWVDVRANVLVTCPERVITYRYYPKYM